MRKFLHRGVLGVAVALAVSSSGATLWAQDTRTEGTTTSRSADRDDGFDYGWLGLAGLIGLLGLMPRDRRERHATPVVHTNR